MGIKCLSKDTVLLIDLEHLEHSTIKRIEIHILATFFQTWSVVTTSKTCELGQNRENGKTCHA